jgi:hypothetical protein
MPTPYAAYRRMRRRRIAEGTWQPHVDGGKARVRLTALSRTGASLLEISAATGLSPNTLRSLAAGEGSVLTSTARAVLAVTPRGIDPALPDAGGTMWRLRGLAAMGHTPARVAAAAGLDPKRLQRVARGEDGRVHRDVRDAVSRVYEAWWDKTPPAGMALERQAAAAVRNKAAANGWPTPMGLSDDRLDTPGYRPRTPYAEARGTGPAEMEAAG